MAEPNYKVAVALYGRYEHGKIIPASVPLAYGSKPEELVRMGTLVPTHEPCNCPILPDEAPALDPTAELVRERNELRDRAARAERNEQLLMAQVEDKDQELAARDLSIQKLTAENGKFDLLARDRLAEIERLKGANAELTKDLEAATAPAKA